MSTIEKYICIFFVYSIAGWFMESFRGWAKTGKFVNRGFLIGPYLPVYGFGVALITIFLEKYVDDISVLFCMSIVLCGVLEYFTSWILEVLFKARWWDYHNRKFNINGRICLETLIPFGILGTVLLKFANPFVLRYLNFIPHNILVFVIIGLIIIILIDTIISYIVMLNFKKTADNVEKEVKDNTEEMNEVMKEVAKEKAQEIKEYADEVIEGIKDDLDEMSKVVKANMKIAKRNVHYTRNKLKDDIYKSIEEFKQKRDNARNDLSKRVKDAFKDKSWLAKRIVESFPELTVVSKKYKNK